MSAECIHCGSDLAYDLSCGRCSQRERAERAEGALRVALVELEPEGGTDPWRDEVIRRCKAVLAAAPNDQESK